jgi:long-chain acyl-CoA synthetase
MKVEGRDRLTRIDRPFLVCPNHQSYLDPIIFCSTVPRSLLKHTFHVGASEFFTNRFMAWLARTLNIVPLDPDANLLRAMLASAAGLRAGKVLNLYPEGNRTFEGLLGEFKHGAAILATELDLPIVPVALDGFHRVWPREAGRLHLAKGRICFGEPIYARSGTSPVLLAGMEGEAAYEALTAAPKRRIQQMLEDMRRREPSPDR